MLRAEKHDVVYFVCGQCMHGSKKGSAGGACPLDFEIWYFPINVSVQIFFLLESS